MLKVT